MKTDITTMQTDMNLMKSQLGENTQLTKAIYHRQEEYDAKLQEEVSSINKNIGQLIADQKSINELLGEHEISIRTLRRTPV
jgi:hypothetical protein